MIAPIRAALVGCGMVAMRGSIPGWLPLGYPNRPQPAPFLSFRPASGLRFAAICDSDRRALRAAQKVLPDALSFTSWDELLHEVKNIKAAVISTPPLFHEAMVLEALSLGWDVFVEKPLAITQAGLSRIASLTSDRKAIVMVNLPWRFSIAAAAILHAIEQGCLGEIQRVNAEFRHPGPRVWAPNAAWYYDDRNPGGAWTDLASHVLDLVLEIMRSSVVSRFHCSSTLRQGRVVRAECKIDFDDGRKGLFEVGWDSALPLFRIDLVGSLANLHAELIRPGKIGYVTIDGKTNLAHGMESPSGPFENFVSCVRLRETPQTGLPRILTSQQLLVRGLNQLMKS